jgi:cytochrome P450
MEHVVPSGPHATSLLGHVNEFIKEPLGFFQQLATYGDVSSFRLAFYKAYLVRSAEDVYDVLVKQGDLFVRDPIMRIASSPFLGRGIINTEGDFHRTQRRLMQPAFHHKRLDAYLAQMVHHTNDMIAGWSAAQEISVNSEIAGVTLKIVCDALFKADISQDVAGIVEAVNAFEEILAVELRQPILLPNWFPIDRKRRMQKAVKTLREVVGNMIQQRREAAHDRGDVLSSLVLARYDNGSPMPDQQILDEMMTMIIAGHETSASVITWVLYLLSLYPEMEARIVDELNNVIGNSPLQLTHLPQLSYLDRVIKETLRLYPPGWLIGRTPLNDTKLSSSGTTIRKGELIYISPFIIHRDARYFKDPLKFDPDRWAGDLEGTLPKGSYLPFSNGYHVCIGQQFALMEIKVILAYLLMHFHFARVDDEPIEPLALATLRTSRTLHLRPVARVTT